jgi:hypothetical protein
MLCPTPDQIAACKAKFCACPLGQLLSNGLAPMGALTGGVIGSCCPNASNNQPNPADLLKDPTGAEGAAARVKKDTAEAKARRAAVRYLATVDCNYWPEAQAALINSLRADRNECVRLEAALALNRGCCCRKEVILALVDCVSGRAVVPLLPPPPVAPPEDSPRVQAAAMLALEHCLACYVDIVKPKLPEAIKKDGGPRGSLPTGVTNALASGKTDSENVYVAYREKAATMTMDQVVQQAHAVLEKVHSGTYVSSTAPTTGHSLSEMMHAAFMTASNVVPEGDEIVESPMASAPVETGAPPLLQPVPAPAPAKAVVAPARVTQAPMPAPVMPTTPARMTPAPMPTPVMPTTPARMTPAPMPTPVTSAMPAPQPPPPPAARPVTYSASTWQDNRPAAAPTPSRPMEPVVSARTPVPVTPAPSDSGELNTPQLLGLLKDSPYPSVRELTAKRLVSRGEVTLPVAEALLHGAKTDIAPGVRAACLRGLMTLHVTGPALAAAAHQLESDKDARVRSTAQEVSRWLQSQSAAPARDHSTVSN